MIRKFGSLLAAMAFILAGLSAPASADGIEWDMAPVSYTKAGPSSPNAKEIRIETLEDLRGLEPGHAYAKIKGKFYQLPAELEKPGTKKAKSINGCPQSSDSGGYGHLCFYDWINWGGGRWQASVNTFWPATVSSPQGPCWNLSGSSFSGGGGVNNSAASYQVTGSTNKPTNAPNDGQYPHVWYWVAFDWVSCQSAGDYIFWAIDYNASDSTLQWNNGGIWESFYENPTSVQMVSDVALRNM